MIRKLASFLITASFLIMSATHIWAQEKAAKIDSLISRYYDYGLFNGTALVADDGKVILSKGYGYANMEWQVPNVPDAKFRIGSISKQFTATIIMQLVEEGKIALDGKITDYLTDYRHDTGDKVTIHHLLTHTSGITSYTSIPHVWSDSLRNHYDQEYFIKHFHSGDLEYEPGTQYSYNNTGYYLLAAIAEKVTGIKFGVLLNERIFEPLGMKNTGSEDDPYILKRKAYGYLKAGNRYLEDPYMYMPNAMGAGHMYSTVEDMLIWDQALYDDQILSEESKEKMFTPFLSGYGYGFAIGWSDLSDTDSVKYIRHFGGINGFNTNFTRLVDQKQTIVLFNNTGPAHLGELGFEIARILNGIDFEYPKEPITSVLATSIDEVGIDSAVNLVKNLYALEKEKFDFTEKDINSLGYLYLEHDEIEKALKIFKLNTELFPDGANTYDSYAEALMKKGDNEKAITNYKKSLALNPGNENAVTMLKKLGVDYEEKKITLSLAILERYEGKYALFPNFNITIRVDGDRIFAQATGQGEFEIFPESETRFYYKVVDAQIEFKAGEDGDIDRLILYQNNREMVGNKVKD